MQKQCAGLLAALAFSSFVPALATPPDRVSAHGQRTQPSREYRYVYYPAQQIYYATEQQIWFWMNGSSWNFGVHLPAQYRSQKSVGVPVMLLTHRPFAEHKYVEQRYGRPWREQHRKKRERRHD